MRRLSTLLALLVVFGALGAQRLAAQTNAEAGAAPPPAAPAVAPAGPGTEPAIAARSESGGASAVATVVLPVERPVARRAQDADHEADETPSLLHGFRLGYVFVANHDEPIQPGRPETSLSARHDLESPHQFLIGYEVMNRMTGSGWLNVLLIGNVSITGLEQSKAFPSANLLLGFELDQSFQMGVGINLMPVDDKPAHMILAAGWTPRTGNVYLPLHVFVIPDIDGNHRLGTTLGVNWGI